MIVQKEVNINIAREKYFSNSIEENIHKSNSKGSNG